MESEKCIVDTAADDMMKITWQTLCLIQRIVWKAHLLLRLWKPSRMKNIYRSMSLVVSSNCCHGQNTTNRLRKKKTILYANKIRCHKLGPPKIYDNTVNIVLIRPMHYHSVVV